MATRKPSPRLTVNFQVSRRLTVAVGGALAVLAVFAAGYLLAAYFARNDIPAPFLPAPVRVLPVGGCGGGYRAPGPLILCPLMQAK